MITDAAPGLTPFLSVNYAYHNFTDLKENGLGDAGLTTNYDDISQLELGLGAGYTKRFAMIMDQDPSRFFASLALRAEFSNRDPEVVNGFKGDPSARFRVRSQERSPLFIQVGAGLAVPAACGKRVAGHFYRTAVSVYCLNESGNLSILTAG